MNGINMKLLELADKVAEIERKYTDKSDFRIHVSVTQERIVRYSIEHSATGRTVNTGYGTTDLKELLTKFEVAMAANYTFAKPSKDDIDI
jgi:hypothetical protein